MKIIYFILAALVLISSCTQGEDVQMDFGENPETVKEPPKSRLGNLCIQEECIEFCQNNRGLCEDYCIKNENPLCKTLFGRRFEKPRESRNSCVSNKNPIFKTAFTDMEKIRSISPPGGIAVGSQSRTYVFAKAYANGSYPIIPIYAPTDATLEAITYAMRGIPPKGRPEYRLDLRVSCEVTIHFDHIPFVTGKIKKAGPKEYADNTRTGAFVSIPIKEGEILGYTDAALVPGFDFYLFNYAKTLEHINPSRWQSDHNKHADCPYDYFEDKALYYSYFASAGGVIQKDPVCRSASRDVKGTMAGGWFLGDSTDMEGTRLLVGSDFGDWVDLVIDRDDLPRFMVRDYDGKDPEGLKVGDEVCYFDSNNHAYLKLLSDNELQVSFGQGQCPSGFPGNAEIFKR